MKSLGFIETRGLVAAVEACDAALKAAGVEFAGKKLPGSGLVTVVVTGDVAAVKAAVEAGAEAASRVGEVAAVQVIARPHDDLITIIEEEPLKPVGGKGAAKPAAKKTGGGRSGAGKPGL